MSRRIIQRAPVHNAKRKMHYAVLKKSGQRYQLTFLADNTALKAGNSTEISPTNLPDRDCTLEAWITFWLREVVKRDLAETTLYAYRNIVRCHILPALGKIRLLELTPLKIQNYLYEKMNQGLSPNTVIKHYVLLNTALRMAVRLELLERAPTERVQPPKRKEIHIDFYSPEQLQKLFSAVENTILELPVKLAAYLGLRRSEICGLRWESVDLEAGVLLIREARTEMGGVVILKSTKTRNSNRRLGIAGLADLQRVLRRAWEQRQSDDPKELVVLRPDGTPPKPDGLTQNLLRVVRKNGLPKISLHGLRHSFASVANSQGIPMFDISRTLGHSSMAVTSNIYTHLFDETESHVLTAVAKAIEQA